MNAAGEQKLLNDLGERLKKLRNKQGISIRELAERVDMGYTNVSNIETGKVNPKYTTLVKLAEALEVDPRELLPK